MPQKPVLPRLSSSLKTYRQLHRDFLFLLLHPPVFGLIAAFFLQELLGLSNAAGASSSKGNVFGFIDPIIDKFTNIDVWALLFIQLLQFYNGLTFFAIMTIYGLVIYFRAVLEVIV